MTEYRKDSLEIGLRILARMIARAHLKAVLNSERTDGIPQEQQTEMKNIGS